jgi:hypothetical protein
MRDRGEISQPIDQTLQRLPSKWWFGKLAVFERLTQQRLGAAKNEEPREIGAFLQVRAQPANIKESRSTISLERALKNECICWFIGKKEHEAAIRTRSGYRCRHANCDRSLAFERS